MPSRRHLLTFSRGYATHRPASRLNAALSLEHVRPVAFFSLALMALQIISQ
jgi:hypothetical protein